MRFVHASISISACSWSGALTTTRGRESAGMDASPFRSVGRPLLAGDEDQARRVERERRAVERSVYVHLTPALGTEHGAQLVGGVETDLRLAYQLTGRRVAGFVGQTPPARVPAARGGVEPILDAQRAVVHRQPLLPRHRPDGMDAVSRVEHEQTAPPERGAEPIEEEAGLVVGG